MKIPSYLFKQKFAGVYCIENSFNGKRYIGSSINMYDRLHKHNSLLNNKKHENCILQNAWNKHGNNVFECYSLEFCSKEELLEVEQRWIDTLNPEYNITLKVERNILSKSSRLKISNTLKEGYRSGRIKLTKTRAISVYDLNGKHIEDYKTIRSCARNLKINNTSIARCLRGTYEQCKGYQFKYKEEDKIIGKIKRSKYIKA